MPRSGKDDPVVTRAKNYMLPSLMRIWEECFGDSRTYISFVFKKLLYSGNILVLTNDSGEALSMLCYEPHIMDLRGEGVNGAYVFGVATAKAHQGKGYGTTLLEKAHTYFACKVFSYSVLVPASESLFGFYGARGYKTGFHIKRAVAKADEIKPATAPCILVSRDLDLLYGLRERHFADITHVSWNREYLRFTGEECRFRGGQTLLASCGGNKAYLVCYPQRESIIIKEFAVPDCMAENVLAALHERLRAKEYVMRLRADAQTGYDADVLPLAMIKWYDKKYSIPFQDMTGAYMSHVLD